MPPQPLSRVHPTAAHNFALDTLTRNQKLAALILRVISTWATIDAMQAHILARFIRADYEIVTAMMEALSGGEARRAAFEAAAKEALTPEDYDLFTLVNKAIRPSRTRRNDFAHHVWGSSPDIPDALLLIDPKDLSKPVWEIATRTRDSIAQRPT